MGCDYYVYTFLCVTTKDGKQHQIQCSRESRYIFEASDDDETYEQILERRMKADAETKLLFSDEKWLIKNEDRIAEYESYITNAKLSLDDIKEMTRIKYCEERF